jgi:hypothetical protein
LDFGCSIDKLDSDEYAVVVEWVRESVEAQSRAARGEDDGPSIDMDAPNWQDQIRR